MTIQRATPTMLQREGRSYAVLPTDSIKLIRSADALAIWTYLQSKPSDWIVRRPQIMQRLDLSRRGYADAMKHLRDTGLVDSFATHDERGVLTGKRLIVYDTPNIPKLVHSAAPNIPVSEHSDSATFAESAPLQIKDIQNTNNGCLQRGESDGKDEKPMPSAHPSFKFYAGPLKTDTSKPSPAEQLLADRAAKGQPCEDSTIAAKLEERRRRRRRTAHGA